jgi:hypothetical protein
VLQGQVVVSKNETSYSKKVLHYTEIIIIIIIIIRVQEGAEKHVMANEGLNIQSVLQFILFTHYC